MMRPSLVKLGPFRALELAPLLVIPCLYGILAVALLEPSESTREVNFAEATWGTPEPMVPSDLVLVSQDAGVETRALTLHGVNWRPLARAQAIRILVATYKAEPNLVQARFEFTGTPCSFTSAPGAELRDNTMIEMMPGPSCAQDLTVDPPELRFSVSTKGPAHIAAWTVRSDPAYPIPVGSFRPQPAEMVPRKSQLLAYMWGADAADGWIWAGVAASFLLVELALVILLVFFRASRAPLALTLLFTGLGIAYATIVPPFQAPDEPTHFLSFVAMTKNPDLTSGTLDMARRGQFERIKFRPQERMTALDFQHPSALGWPAHIATLNLGLRSKMAARIASALAPHFATLTAPEALIGLRLLNIAFVAVCVAFGSALVVSASAPAVLAAAAAPILLTPTLAFFSMAVSNYPLLIGGFWLQGAALALLIARRGPSLQAGIAAGVGLALAAWSGKSGVAVTAFWLVTLTLQAGFSGLEPKSFKGSALKIIPALGGFLAAYLLGTMLVSGSWNGFDPFTWGLEELARRWAHETQAFRGTWLMNPWIWVAVIVVVGSTVFALKSNPWIRALYPKSWTPRLVRIVAAAIAIIVLGGFLFTKQPVPTIEAESAIDLSKYLRRVLRAFFLGLGTGEMDDYLGKTFWGGFGWLEVFPAPAYFALVKGLPAAAALFVAARLWRQPRADIAAWFVSGTLGIAVYLASLAVGCYHLKTNLHGRYLIGVYFLLSTLVYVVAATDVSERFRRRAVPIVVVLGGIAHGAAWLFIVGRYFG